MKRALMLLASPLLLTGCLHLPGMPGGNEDVARNKTVQKGQPKQIDPNIQPTAKLKPLQTPGLTGMNHDSNYSAIPSSQVFSPTANSHGPITADQVNENNALPSMEHLRNEIAKDLNNSNAPGSWGP